MITTKTVQELFEEKFIKTDWCWEWTASKKLDGYGQFWFDGGMRKAHRVAYQLYVGEIPYNLQVLHRCDNPACVNPSHLFLGTHTDNMRDCMNKGRLANKSGENNGHSKLTVEDVRLIRTLWSKGAMVTVLARAFRVTGSAISDIVRGHTWKNV